MQNQEILELKVAVIGAGPAGLAAAEALMQAGVQVDVFDAMASSGRKFLLAGRSGMNLTHAEPFEAFAARYYERRPQLEPMLRAFGPQAIRDWVHGLGIETFVGTSGRVFPVDMKAAPLLRAWLKRLRDGGVRFHSRHRWCGWDETGTLRFTTPDGERLVRAQAVLLALGGASWARLGSDGAWAPWLEAKGVDVAPLKSANCGFEIGWSEHFASRFAGQPLKSASLAFRDRHGQLHSRKGQFVVSSYGIEGSLVYALAKPLREQLEAQGRATLWLDLLPDWNAERVARAVAHPRGSRSLASHLQSRLGLTGVQSGLLRECLSKEAFTDPVQLAQAIKALPLELKATRPIDEAISSAGGVRFEDMDEHLMLKALPGMFCAGEMLDWEAPTGGYLLTACFASGRWAGQGMYEWLQRTRE